MAFTPLIPLLPKRPRSQNSQVSPLNGFIFIVRSSLSISTWLLLGGLLQGLILLALPYWWTILPTILILATRFSHTVLITLKLIPNPYLRDSVLEWASAQLPDPQSGDFASQPASQQVAVLHLGAKYNHPLGPFAPHASKLTEFAIHMYAALDKNKPHNGYLGGQDYTTYDDRGAVEFTFVGYFRSIDDIHRFAYSDAHRAGWEWWNSVPKEDIKHLGINHEIFLAREGEWETIYLNCQPTMLGGTHSLRRGDKEIGGQVGDGWVTNLVKADGKLRTSAGRLGWGKEVLSERLGYVPKATNGEKDDDRLVQ